MEKETRSEVRVIISKINVLIKIFDSSSNRFHITQTSHEGIGLLASRGDGNYCCQIRNSVRTCKKSPWKTSASQNLTRFFNITSSEGKMPNCEDGLHEGGSDTIKLTSCLSIAI